MALHDDPNNPFGMTWPPPEWGFGPPMPAPAPSAMPPVGAPASAPALSPSADPYWDPNAPTDPNPQAYDDFESNGMTTPRPAIAPEPAAPPAPIGSNLDYIKRSFSPEAAREFAADTRDALAPVLAPVGIDTAQRALQAKIAPPRTDAARIAQSTKPIGTVGQIGNDVDPNAPQQPTIGELPTFTAEEMAAVTGRPMTYIDFDQPAPTIPYIGFPRRDLGEMPEDFVGGPSNQGFVEMPEDFAGHELGPQDPYPDVATGMAADFGRAIGAGADAAGRFVKGTDKRAPEMPEEYLEDDEYARAVGRKPPEEQAEILKKIAHAQNNFAATRVMEESEKLRRAQEDSLRMRNEAIAKAKARAAEIDADATRIANANPTDSIPAYRKVAGVLAAFVGGWAANKTGRNMGLEVVDQIAQEAAQQQAQRLSVLAKQRAGVGEDIATAEDTHRAATAAALATYDIFERRLKAEIQKFDQRGALVQELVPTLQEIQAKRGQLAAEAQQQDFENSMKAGELTMKVRHQGLEEAKFLADEKRKAMAGVGDGVLSKTGFFDPTSGGWAAFPEGVKLTAPERTEIRLAGEHYVNYRNGLRRLKSLVDEVQSRSVKGAISDKWRSEKEREYKTIATMLAFEQAKMADPNSVVRESEFKEFSSILPMPSSIFGNEYAAADGVYKQLSEVADSKYATKMRGIGLDPGGVVSSVQGMEHTRQGPPTSLSLASSVAPDYVPGHTFGIGPDSDVVSGWDSYVRNFVDNRIDGTNEQLRTELGALVDKNRASLKKAEGALAKAQQAAQGRKDPATKQTVEKALEVKNRWQTIVTDQEERLRTLDVDAERSKAEDENKSTRKAKALGARPQPRR